MFLMPSIYFTFSTQCSERVQDKDLVSSKTKKQRNKGATNLQDAQHRISSSSEFRGSAHSSRSFPWTVKEEIRID